jgi:tRNA-uridine 2-sulfurtransferase
MDEQFDIPIEIKGNPDVFCNRYIKFGNFFENSLKKFEGDYIATGHYVRNQGSHLLKGLDPSKDQSYFLSMVHGEKLLKSIFPVGDLMKSQVRDIARIENLDMISEKKDSVGIYFNFLMLEVCASLEKETLNNF